MENGLVNLINHMPADLYRHVIICMTDYTDFRQRLRRDDVAVHALHKREGKDLGVHRKLFRLLRALRPDIVHTRNLATLEAQVIARLAGVRVRIHGEHGWDVADPDGSSGTTSGKNRWLRRLVRPLMSHYIALSRQQVDYLQRQIGVDPKRITHIYNGVDTRRFSPPDAQWQSSAPPDFAPEGCCVIGAVMRMQAVKAPEDLARAFVCLRERLTDRFANLRLIMVGDGPLYDKVSRILSDADVAHQCWLPGAREDIPELLRNMDMLVVPSLAEGICNTVLEAMATGLPVIATDVGGNPELVQHQSTGSLVPARDPEALANVLATYALNPDRCRQEGTAARAQVLEKFSLDAMVRNYMAVYNQAAGAASQRGLDAA